LKKIPVLRPLKEGTKIVKTGRSIQIDIRLPLDWEDYELFKEMYEMDIDVSGRIIDDQNRIIGTFSNAVRSIDSNIPALE